MLTKENLSLILKYLATYNNFVETEEIYKKIPSYEWKLKYIDAHSKYERDLGKILGIMDPFEMTKLLKDIKQLCDVVSQDVSTLFNLQSSEE